MANNASCDACQHFSESSDSEDGQRTCTVLGEGIVIENLADDLYRFRLTSPQIPSIKRHMVVALRQSGELCMPINGVLLDVQTVTHLSIVRLASFLDAIGSLSPLIAVVFRDKTQCRLASLLHNTLIDKDSIAYFTDPRAAIMFLTLTV
jgi:hypothetical protein